MPRGFKCRRVCSVPDNRVFIPQKPCSGTVTLTVEELETVRLCDLESLDQEAASLSMNVSRATFQRILYQARKKVAEALCTGKKIEIAGGNYELAERHCGCHHRCANCRFKNKTETKE